MQAAGDEPGFEQAVGLPQLREHDGACQACHGGHAHEQAQQGAADALSIGVTRGDAVKPEHRGIQEGQPHARQEDWLAVVGLPAISPGSQQLPELPDT